MESISSGYKAIFEGYADVRDSVESIDIYTLADKIAARNSPVMDFILRSGEQNASKFTYGDDEPELNRPASPFNRCGEIEDVITGDNIEDSVGLTAGDLHDKQVAVRQVGNQSKPTAVAVKSTDPFDLSDFGSDF